MTLVQMAGMISNLVNDGRDLISPGTPGWCLSRWHSCTSNLCVEGALSSVYALACDCGTRDEFNSQSVNGYYQAGTTARLRRHTVPMCLRYMWHANQIRDRDVAKMVFVQSI